MFGFSNTVRAQGYQCIACKAGYFSNNGKCDECPAGTYSATGSGECSLCPTGSWAPALSNKCYSCGGGITGIACNR